MSAEILRRAASLMRERAAAATSGPWISYGHTVEGAGTVYFDKHALHNDAEHIASWHPAVALAVADWLDDALDAHLHVRVGNYPSFVKAVAVARAYLGEQA